MTTDFDEILHRNLQNAAAAEHARRTNAEAKVFDWDKAAAMIAKENPRLAEAGILEDWFWTGATVFEDGQIPEHPFGGPYCASIWATPILMLDDRVVDCWRYESEVPEWDAQTYWPESARTILREGLFANPPAVEKILKPDKVGGDDYGTRYLRIPKTDSGDES